MERLKISEAQDFGNLLSFVVRLEQLPVLHSAKLILRVKSVDFESKSSNVVCAQNNKFATYQTKSNHVWWVGFGLRFFVTFFLTSQFELTTIIERDFKNLQIIEFICFLEFDFNGRRSIGR